MLVKLVKLVKLFLIVGTYSTAAAVELANTIPTGKEYVDYVNPYIGNISHLLVPTFPTVQLPNSMLRVYPERADYTSEQVSGLPIVVTTHRERSAFKLMPQVDEKAKVRVAYNYENEHLTPYLYETDLDDCRMSARLAVSHQSAVYEITFRTGSPSIVLSSADGDMKYGSNWVSGWQTVSGSTKVYVYLESEVAPERIGSLGSHAALMRYGDRPQTVRLRYGISYISEQQAKANLYREIKGYDIDAVISAGRQAWNQTLGRIRIKGGTEDEKTVFYSSYYRTFERPICMSEDGRYWSAFDGQVHADGGSAFYNDDWIWDTYRAAHPLRLLTDQQKEERIIDSYLRMAHQMGTGWMPTFPEVNGDSRRMNSNHGVAMVADALAKGLKVDAPAAFEACRKGIEEKTLAPWSGAKAGPLDAFYRQHGYIPAIREGETETDPNVNGHEKRQPVAVTLGTSYDEWCLSRIADYISRNTKNKKQAAYWADEAGKYAKAGLNYRHLWNAKTGFFHPKDSTGRFIEPFDYRYSGGQGARYYYGENNGWTYRWDVQHNIADLIRLMGGQEQFVRNLDQTFIEPLGESKFDFYSHLPDHTGNVGMFSMANEPSFHIPYLYNYAGQPWKTQRTIRKLLREWYRNDLMGIPGDEDGGGMTAFVVFSMLGFYPVTPGIAAYNIGSPVFEEAEITLSNGKTLAIIARGASAENKYIQRATLNGKAWNQPWFSHDDIKDGGTLELEMGRYPNKQWGTESVPPSAGIGATAQTRIACLGASITEGYGTTQPWSKNAYPGQLQTLLGTGYRVENYGRGGCTMIKKGEMPYWNYEQFEQAKASNPDIVFIDLGGNDAKLVHRIHKDDFVDDACELVYQMQQLPSHPRVILMTAIPGFTNDSTQIWDTAIVRDINPRILEAARLMHVEVLDMHHLLEDHSDLMPDDIHPNDEGAAIMARKMAWYLKTYPQKPSEDMTIDGMADNPFVTHIFTADPSAHVWPDGRLYVYASHDLYPPRGCDRMDEYHVFSTDDMIHWKDHGEILRQSQVPWGRKEGGWMWAPDAAYANGKYYFYFPHPSETETFHSWKVGVAVSDYPDRDFQVVGYVKGVPSAIDPCVFVDDDGQAYIYNGGGTGPNCYGGRLKNNMVELDGEMKPMDGLVDFHEAAWVHKYDGKYYLSYADNHVDEKGVQYNNLRYAVSDSPLGPWEYKGIYLTPTDCDTSHGSIVEYKGQWYQFYHNCALTQRGNLRSICVDRLYYNPDGTIQTVHQRNHSLKPRK